MAKPITVKVIADDSARFARRKTISRSITVYGATGVDDVIKEIQTLLPWRTTRVDDRRHGGRRRLR